MKKKNGGGIAIPGVNIYIKCINIHIKLNNTVIKIIGINWKQGKEINRIGKNKTDLSMHNI